MSDVPLRSSALDDENATLESSQFQVSMSDVPLRSSAPARMWWLVLPAINTEVSMSDVPLRSSALN
jgi:hypothetical protein